MVLLDSRHERQVIMRVMVEAALGKGAVVADTATAAQASEAVTRQGAGVAVIEIQLALAGGLAAVAFLRAAHPDLVIVVCTFHGGAAMVQDALDAGADAYLPKPVSPVDLRAIVDAGHRVPLAVA